MARRALSLGLLCVLAAPLGAVAADDPRTSAAFLQGLRDRGYFDLATEYLEALAKQPDAPADLVETFDYELGRLLLDEAARTGDLVLRKDRLDQARARLDAFVKAKPDHPKAPEANVQLAKLLVLRGNLAFDQVDEVEAAAEKAARLGEARAAFDQARGAYAAAEAKLQANFTKFPRFLPEGDPRIADRDRTHFALMDAQLQKFVVDYEKGQTYPAGSKERSDLMSTALAGFDEIYKRYRTQFAGLAARMWQGKCYEERGELGPAMGIYNELMTHRDPRLADLQRHVGYFRIIVLGKRKEHALAADEAVRWLQAYKGPEGQRSPEGLGVQLELAKNIVAQLPSTPSAAEKADATKRVVEVLSGVVRYSSRYKAEALALLRQYKPSVAAGAADVGRLSYEDAVTQSEEAIASREWDKAAALLKQALRRAALLKDVDKTNYARYHLAFVDYMNKRYYEAAVLAEHLARRYPQAGLAPKAVEIALAAYSESYTTDTSADRASDLKRMIDLARYAAAAFPETEPGDKAKLTLGQIEQGTGHNAEAVAAYESVRPKSTHWLEAQSRLGSTHWDLGQSLRRAGKAAEADAEAAKAVSTLQGSLKSRQDAGTPGSDPGLVLNACDLADIYLLTDRPADAFKVLDPLASLAAPVTGAPYGRLVSTLLRAHVATGQVDLAMADMAAIESKGGEGVNLTQLYFDLGRLLEREMETLRKKGDGARLNQTRQAFLKFLLAVATRQSGQTFESMRWAGANLLALGNAREANAVLNKAITTYEKDPKFLAAPDSDRKLFLARVQLAASLRDLGKFAEADDLIGRLALEKPKTIEPIMEQGYLVEAKAAAGLATWAQASAQWRQIATRLGAAKTKPQAYYEAWYHAALALNQDKKPKEAKQTLAGVMRLSSTVGGPEMKEKYQALLAQIK